MTHADEIIRSYSPEVTRRLFNLTKPYNTAVFLTIVALIISTAAELLTPIVIRRTVDDHLLHREYRIDLAVIQPGILNSQLTDEFLQAGRTIGKHLFLPAEELKALNAKEKDALRQANSLDEEDWYVFQAVTESATQVVNNYSNLFVSSKDWHAIRIKDRARLGAEDRWKIRYTDRLGLKQRSFQYLGLLIIILVFTFIQVYTASWTGQKVMADIRNSLFSHIIHQSLGYLGGTPVGSLVSRTANDVETIAEFFTNITISFLKDFSIMAGVIFVMFALDVRLALISMTALIPTFMLIVIFRTRMREAFRRVRARVSAVNAFLSERLSGINTIQLFAAEESSIHKFDEKGTALLETEMTQIRIMAIFRPLIELFASALVALVIWYSTNLHETGLVSLGVLIAFVELIQKFFQPVKDIAEKFNILQSAMAGGERIFALLDKSERIPEHQIESKPKSDQITFDNVHFSYVHGEPVLKGLNFTIPAGSTTAIVGTTGAGKSTVANLLTRLWDPQEGQILLDNQDIRSIPLSSLRRIIQPIQQDVFLFRGSIAENIDLGLGLSRKEIERVGELSKADTFIHRLPMGYDTQISEGAINLSAGQRQLIAFARIIAHNPNVIILDEATANIDTETEALLQEGMESLSQNRTTMIIAHRLSTICRADQILVLGRGRLIETGNHEELLARRGAYYDLYKLQLL